MTIRERIERSERDNLSPHAALSAETLGRRHPQAPCPVRTEYQRDRDRIIHLCQAFRRLAYKTQVFFSPQSDYLRTRLSHTLEVSQIACTIGGNVAENSGGVHCLKYGLTANNVLGIEMVLISGEIIRLGGKHLGHIGFVAARLACFIFAQAFMNEQFGCTHLCIGASNWKLHTLILSDRAPE